MHALTYQSETTKGSLVVFVRLRDGEERENALPVCASEFSWVCELRGISAKKRESIYEATDGILPTDLQNVIWTLFNRIGPCVCGGCEGISYVLQNELIIYRESEEMGRF